MRAWYKHNSPCYCKSSLCWTEGKNGKHNKKETQARWGMRWRVGLSTVQNAASSITPGALDIQRATGLRNLPHLTEKNAINTFVFFSPSLSPDLFMFLELCLHCFAFIWGDIGYCSTRIKRISTFSTLQEKQVVWVGLVCFRKQRTVLGFIVKFLSGDDS